MASIANEQYMNSGAGRGDFFIFLTNFMHGRKNPIYLSFEMSECSYNSEDHVSYGQIFYSLRHIFFTLVYISILLKIQSKGIA